MFSRLTEYLTPEVKKDLFVTSNMEVDPTIALHMDIVFPNAPCGSKYTLINANFFCTLVLDFKFQTGYSTMQRAEMPLFRFLDIYRDTNEEIGEAPLTMDMASEEKYNKIKE